MRNGSLEVQYSSPNLDCGHQASEDICGWPASTETFTEPCPADVIRPTKAGAGSVPVEDGNPFASLGEFSQAKCATTRLSKLSWVVGLSIGPPPSLRWIMTARLKNPVAAPELILPNSGKVDCHPA